MTDSAFDNLLKSRMGRKILNNLAGATTEARKFRKAETHAEVIAAKRAMLDRAEKIAPHNPRARQRLGRAEKTKRNFIIDGEPEPPMPIAIYALSSTLNGAVRYIGKTKDPRERMHRHINSSEDSAFPKDRWIFTTAKAGHLRMTILAWVHPKDWVEAERRCIAEARAAGDRLFNIADGG